MTLIDRPATDTRSPLRLDVTMYHSISRSDQPDPHRVRVHPDRLDLQLRHLRRLGLRGVSLGEAVAASERGAARGLVGITFDDGYADFVSEAMPVLARYGMTATVFVVAGNLGGTNDWDDGPVVDLMDDAAVRATVAAGHEVGSHSRRHVRLSGLPAGELRAELEESRRILTGLTGRPVDGFCYPYGDFDDAVAAAVVSAGYRYACVTDDYARPGRFTIPRFHVGQRDGVVRLSVKLARHRLRGGGTSRPAPPARPIS